MNTLTLTTREAELLREALNNAIEAEHDAACECELSEEERKAAERTMLALGLIAERLGE